MLRVALPALLIMVMSIVIDLTEFDIMDAEWTTDLIFEYEEFPDETF